MKINLLRLSFVFSFTLLSFTMIAQKSATKEADAMYKSHRYSKAIELYKESYSRERSVTKKKLIIFRVGYSYYELQDFDNAKVWLGKAIKAGYKDPEAQFYYANIFRRIGQYDQAIVEFKKYKELVPSDSRSDRYIKECETSQDWLDNPTRYMVEKDPVINSKKSDFSTSWADKRHTSIMFTSTREGSLGDNEDAVTGQNYSSIWVTKQDKKSKKWMVPTLIDEGVINQGEANEGSASTDSKFKTVYFTRCATKKKTKLGCAIYVSKKVGKTWSEAELIPLAKGDTSITGHPSIGLKDQYLFFASNMAGGQGGKDIWFVKYNKKGKSWSDPINAGADVNTEGDEMFPYIREDGKLYFASNGHPGMGSLDIFSADRVGITDKWNNIQNMKSPINTSYNDYAILFDGTQERGYLTSDRPGGRGSDDIWSFRIPPLKFILAGSVTDVKSGEPIPGVSIKLLDLDGKSVEIKTDELGYFEFDQVPGSTNRYIKGETSYTMIVTKEKYLSGKGQETTLGLTESTKMVHDFTLQSIQEGEIVFPEVLYDLAKWELQVNDSVNSKDSLDFLYQTLIDNPTIVIELMSNTDSRGRDKANMILSEKRAQSCVDYLVTKGIPSDRMQAKGYGETNLLISDEVIKSLPSKQEQEAAHQKNRRTTFRVIRDDYVPAPTEPAPTEGEDSGN